MKNILILSVIYLSLFLSSCNKVNDLSIHIIDVGQGDSVLIKTPSNKNILVDGGNEDSYSLIKSYLKKEDIDTLDIILISHFDSDHIGGLDNIINDFNVKEVYSPQQVLDTTSYNNLDMACNFKDISIKHLFNGDSLKIEDEIILNILNPSFIQEENNLNSIAFVLNFKNKSFLFTGDIESDNESDIINSYDLDDIDFLKVAHHGSSSSSTDKFISEVTPDISVISCGYKNQYGHPHKSTLDTLSKYNSLVYRTDLIGDIVFYSDGNIIYTTENYNINEQ